MARRRKVWMYCPPRPKKPKVPDEVKAELSIKAQKLIDEHLKPTHVKPPPKNPKFNYATELFTRWYQSYFYFCSIRTSADQNAIPPSYERRFARMGYEGEDRFNLSYMRYTGQWWEIYSGRTIDECLTLIREEPHFIP